VNLFLCTSARRLTFIFTDRCLFVAFFTLIFSIQHAFAAVDQILLISEIDSIVKRILVVFFWFSFNSGT